MFKTTAHLVFAADNEEGHATNAVLHAHRIGLRPHMVHTLVAPNQLLDPLLIQPALVWTFAYTERLECRVTLTQNLRSQQRATRKLGQGI